MADLSNPIINGPYDPPSRYFEIGPQGPTGDVQEGRRPSESFIPIASTKKGAGPRLCRRHSTSTSLASGARLTA